MRLSPRLLSLVAGTATLASLAPLAGCMESRAAAEPAPVVVAAPTSAPVRGNWGVPVSPVVMRPIDFEAPPPAPAQVPVAVAPAAPEPVLVSVAPESVEEDVPATPRRVRNARPDLSPDSVSPGPAQPPELMPDVTTIAPDWQVAAACGRG
jgi:hypothetical protein